MNALNSCFVLDPPEFSESQTTPPTSDQDFFLYYYFLLQRTILIIGFSTYFLLPSPYVLELLRTHLIRSGRHKYPWPTTWIVSLIFALNFKNYLEIALIFVTSAVCLLLLIAAFMVGGEDDAEGNLTDFGRYHRARASFQILSVLWIVLHSSEPVLLRQKWLFDLSQWKWWSQGSLLGYAMDWRSSGQLLLLTYHAFIQKFVYGKIVCRSSTHLLGTAAILLLVAKDRVWKLDGGRKR